jgi:hypothetical protein
LNDPGLDEQLRDELLSHIQECTFEPSRDDRLGLTRWETSDEHACEHVASALAARQYFHSHVIEDSEAIEGVVIACEDCYRKAEDQVGSVQRWAVCPQCRKEFNLTDGWRDLKRLAPRYHEAFSSWWARVRQSLPNVPEDVAQQWIHRHWGQSPYEWLPLRSLVFSEETWPLNRMLDTVAGRVGHEERHWGNAPLEIPSSWLGNSVSRLGTWPVRVVVFDNSSAALPEFHPAQLLEGHTRLGYLRTLAQAGSAKATHDVWVARLAP